MLNRALKLIRSYHDISQTDLSAQLGVSNSFLSEIESGKKQPSIDLLTKYSQKFDIPLSSIVFFSEKLDESKASDKIRLGVARKIISILEWNDNKNAAKKKTLEEKKAG